jgi:curli biogenesis system outer membrane secretion channel CsgG
LAAAMLAGAVALAGCSSAEAPPDEPDYASSDVEGPQIQQVRPPYWGSTLAVVPFVNKSLSEYKKLGDIAPDVVVAYAIEAGWRPVEGQSAQLDEVMKELNFGQTEYVNPESAARIGNMLGARFVMIGAVTNFRITKTKGKKGVDVFGIVEVGSSAQVLTYDVQISGRIVDVETREIISADAGPSYKQRFSVEGDKWSVLGVSGETKEVVENERDSMGKVLKIAFAKSFNKMTDQLNRRPPPGWQPPPPGPAPTAPSGGTGTSTGGGQ